MTSEVIISNENDKKQAGYALILGAFLITVTMVLHPAGGKFEHLIKITKLNVTAHSLAILSIPILLFGFLGVHRSFTKAKNLSVLSFIIISLGCIAGMIAAALNGLTLSIFVNWYSDATPEIIESLKPILKYTTALNHAFDYIFIGAICLSIILWSVATLKTKAYPYWLAYFGIFLNVCFLGGLIAAFNFTSLYGFRIFIFSLVTWIIAIGFLLTKQDTEINSKR